MPITLARIDDRLIHGQVVEGWIPHTKAEEVVVVSDESAEDPTQSTLMRIALPEKVALSVLKVAAAAARLAGAESEVRRLLVLAPGPAEILGLLEGGVKLKQVNVGGLHYTAGRVQLGKAIFLGAEDRRALRRIGEFGVELEGRAVPSDKAVDILGLLGGK